MVWLTFCSMVVMITKDMGWTWKYSIAVIVLGPIGGVMVWERIRREGVPRAPTTRVRLNRSEHPPRDPGRTHARSVTRYRAIRTDDRATWVIRPG